jgi:Zn-finger nucleic acid-binding protein
MNCPHDQTLLDLQGYWKFPRHHCGKCKGYLLGEKEVMDMLGERIGANASVARAQLGRRTPGKVKCPADAQPMTVIVDQGVEIDICPACLTVWLDGGEQEKLKAAKARAQAAAKAQAQSSSGGFDSGDLADSGFDVGDAIGDILGSALDISP